jgi:hypothetical protein
MTRKKASEIFGLKKRVFHEKPGKLLPEYPRVASERMLVQDSYWFPRKTGFQRTLFLSTYSSEKMGALNRK